MIGFTFLVPAHLGSPGKGPLNGCVCVCVCVCVRYGAATMWLLATAHQSTLVCVKRTYTLRRLSVSVGIEL